MTAASKSTFIISDNQKEYQLLNTVNKQCHVTPSLSLEVQIERDMCSFHAMSDGQTTPHV
jgi:hypothetical protein